MSAMRPAVVEVHCYPGRPEKLWVHKVTNYIGLLPSEEVSRAALGLLMERGINVVVTKRKT